VSCLTSGGALEVAATALEIFDLGRVTLSVAGGTVAVVGALQLCGALLVAVDAEAV
jgi:hypothetical protein